MARHDRTRTSNNPPSRDARVAEFASRHHGLATIEELHAAGLSNSDVWYRVRRGRLFPLFEGVYMVGHRCITRDSWFLGAMLAVGDDSGLGFFSAVQHHELWKGRVAEVHVVVPRRAKHRDGIRIHSVGTAPAWEEVRGIRVVPPVLAVLQFAAVTRSLKEVRRVAREAQVLGLAGHDELLAGCVAGARGAKRLRLALDGGRAATRNGGEDAALELIRSCGLDPLVNEPLLGYVADFYLPEYGLVIEFDGSVHAIPIVQADDRRRQADFEAAGLRVMRIDPNDVRRHRQQTRRRILAATAPELRIIRRFVAVA